MSKILVHYPSRSTKSTPLKIKSEIQNYRKELINRIDKLVNINVDKSLNISLKWLNDEQLKIGSGFDQNYCIDGYDGKKLIDIANIKSDKTGIVLTVSTNLPGFQFYTANHLGKPIQPLGKSGKQYQKRSSLCVEPQFYPNAINIENFEKPILRKNQKFQREIVYKFGIN